MTENTLITLIIVGLALFIWVPAIIWSVRRVLRKDRSADARHPRPDRGSRPNNKKTQ